MISHLPGNRGGQDPKPAAVRGNNSSQTQLRSVNDGFETQLRSVNDGDVGARS